jgi:hypothetical protein
MYGPDWPNNGEVDILEGGNTALKNLMSAHTYVWLPCCLSLRDMLTDYLIQRGGLHPAPHRLYWYSGQHRLHKPRCKYL